MTLRDEVESAICAWDAYEKTRSGPKVIDYDCRPDPTDQEPRGRLETYRLLSGLSTEADKNGDAAMVRRIGAHLAYLRALLGERPVLDQYVQATQGCAAAGWPDDYVSGVGDVARSYLDGIGVPWGPDTEKELNEAEGQVELEAVPDEIRALTDKYDPLVRAATGTTAPYTLNIETANIDDYWAYWLDGVGENARLRLNLRHCRFTHVRLRSLVLHEVMGHALQGASYAHQAKQTEVPWVRLLSVHAPQQVLLEGLAQAMPLFVTPDDEALIGRLRLVHYLQLVRAELHLAINNSASLDSCAEHARKRAPFWDDEQIGDILSDRGANVLLCSYLWSYPAGLDWFANLADHGDMETISNVLHAAFERPLCPTDLVELWPSGPPIGGPGASTDDVY